MKIYTKTGDNGTTGLFAGPRVPKDHPRIQAYGSVDELNAHLGLVVATMGAPAGELARSGTAPASVDAVGTTSQDRSRDLAELILAIQTDLFSIGAQLATPDPVEQGLCLLTDERVTALEQAIDASESELESLSHFILPGGTPTSAMLHVARTVCRRAERDLVRLAREPDAVHCERLIIYLNRLSDLLFSLARLANARSEVGERPWKRPAGA